MTRVGARGRHESIAGGWTPWGTQANAEDLASSSRGMRGLLPVHSVECTTKRYSDIQTWRILPVNQTRYKWKIMAIQLPSYK